MDDATTASAWMWNTRSGVAEAIGVLAGGVLAAGVVVTMAVFRVLDTFRPAGIAWTVTIDAQPVDATVGSGAGRVSGIAERLTILATGVDTAAAAAAVASIAIWTLAALIVIVCAEHIAWSIQRGRFFVASTARDFGIACWTLVAGGALIYMCDELARRGVLAALGLGDIAAPFPLGFWASWAIGFTIGLLGVAFRRGIRLQRDTEGLV